MGYPCGGPSFAAYGAASPRADCMRKALFGTHSPAWGADRQRLSAKRGGGLPVRSVRTSSAGVMYPVLLEPLYTVARSALLAVLTARLSIESARAADASRAAQCNEGCFSICKYEDADVRTIAVCGRNLACLSAL